MNLAAYRGVYLWEVNQRGTGMTMKAAGGSWEILQECAEKTGCKLELLGEGGLPAFFRRFRKRQVWTAGLLFFAAGLYFLSSFVWMVEVEGNERLTKAELLSFCEKEGLRPGAWKRKLDTEALTAALLEEFSDISWVSVGIHGTDAAIRLAETIPQTEPVDLETPCDVVANTDGVILQITAERGTPLVAAGDVVEQGDVLISAELLIGLEGEEQHTEYTAAEGSVTARLWKRLSEEVPLQYEEKRYLGIEKENHSLILGEQELDFLHPAMETRWEKSLLSEKPLALGDFTLPLKWKREVWKAYELCPKERTEAEAKKLLEEKLRKKAENLLSVFGKIEEINIQYESYADHVQGEATVTMTERIGEKRKRTQEKECENADGI